MNIVDEVWKDIPGFPLYQASSLGRIRGPKSILKAAFNGHGYLHVSVTSPKRTVTVHKLVALAFLGEREAGTQSNHKDGNKTNNRPENLEYVTSTSNNHHALRTGLRRMKIADGQIDEIRRLADSVSLREIGRRFGIHHSYVRYLISGNRKVRS